VSWTHDFLAVVRVDAQLHIVDVPDKVSLVAGPGYHPVVATANGAAFHAALTPRSGGRHRLHLPVEVRQTAGIAVGDTVAMVVQPDPTGSVPAVPDDVGRALDAIEGGRRRFDALPTPVAREMLAWIDSAARSDDRVRRIVRLLARVVEPA